MQRSFNAITSQQRGFKMQIIEYFLVALILTSTEALADRYDGYANEQIYQRRDNFMQTAELVGSAAGCGLVNAGWAHGALLQMASSQGSETRFFWARQHTSLIDDTERAEARGVKAAKIAGACDYFPAHPDEVVRIRQLINMALRTKLY